MDPRRSKIFTGYWPMILILAGLVGIATAIPKIEDISFIPSAMAYMESQEGAAKREKLQDQLSMASSPIGSNNHHHHAQQQQTKPRRDYDLAASGNGNNKVAGNEVGASERAQEPRFGYTNVGDNGVSGTGYGVAGYNPARIDLGGLILGAILGVGTILIIPKLLYVLSGNYGVYARSDEGGISHAMSKLDEALTNHGIDATTCMQRLACSYSRQASEAVRAAQSGDEIDQLSTVDKMVDALGSNPVIRAILQGTAVQEAMESGRQGQSCARLYQQCGFSADTIIGLLAKIAMANGMGGGNAKSAT